MTSIRSAHDINLKPRTGDVTIEENVDFRGLLLSDDIQKGLTKCGFQRPSPIQLKGIPLGRCGLDLIVQAKSGTGKTCVFSVIALEGIILDSLATQVLVLAPTREIAVQICEVINSIGGCMEGLQCMTFIGGTPLHDDKQKLTHCHIAVGTPGRVKQLIEERILPTSNIRLFVLDEADKLLEQNFQEQINWIFSSLPDNKQMLALSATYPEVLAQHLTAYMRNPTFLRLNVTDPALLGIRQYYKKVDFHPLANKLFDRKTDALLELLSTVEFHQCLVFSNYQMRAESLSEVLNFRGWPATYISGSRDQQDRFAAMTSLKEMTCRVLISTDLTSRGIDAENVNLVVNLDLPPDNETYLHRIGRAGRFGTYGAGVSIVGDGKEMEELHRLEKACNTKIKPLPDPIPTDLARSSGFVNLDHLVSSETIITQKDVQVKSKVTISSQDIQPNANYPNIAESQNGTKKSTTHSVETNSDNSVIESKAENVNGSHGATQNGERTHKVTAEVEKPNETTAGSDSPSDSPQRTIKPKWKTNNVWTNLSFSYGEEAKHMENQKKKGKLVSASPADQRRNVGPTTMSGRGDVRNNDEAEHVKELDTEIQGKGDNKKPISDGKPGVHTKAPSLTIPSLRDIRGSSSKPRPFSEIIQDFKDFMENGDDVVVVKTVDCKEDTSVCRRYLNSVTKVLEDLSDRDLEISRTLVQDDADSDKPQEQLGDSGKGTNHAGDSNKVIDVEKDMTAGPDIFHKENAQECSTARPNTINIEGSRAKPDMINTDEARDIGKKISPQKKTTNQKLIDCQKKTAEPVKQVTINPEVTGQLPSETAPLKETAIERPHSKDKGKGAIPKRQITDPSLATMMTNYESLNGSHKGNGSEHFENDACVTSTNPTQKTKKPKKKVSPYGSWEPYVKPEPVAEVYYEEEYPLEEETYDKEDCGEESEDDSDEESESEWESSSISCAEDEEPDGIAEGAGASSKHQHSAQNVYPPEYWNYSQSPWCNPTPDGDEAYKNMWMAQQAMYYTNTCYQQYMMHLQYAEFYKTLLKEQETQWTWEDMYADHKKYIKKMAKWMAKHGH